MPRLDLDAIPPTNATGYPADYAGVIRDRWYRKLAPPAGITDFGISHVSLAPGAWSSQRHWHADEDEFLVILSGTAVLIDDHGRTPLRAGDCAAFPKGDGNGHHLVNEGECPCVYVVVGRASASDCHYPDIDMAIDGATQTYRRKDGTPY